jgi:hypothetical protein
MTMMLVAMFVSVGLGMFVRRWARREALMCVLIAAALTFYYLFRQSSMT